MKWLYHKEHGARLFKADENPAGWFDTPAKFESEEKPSENAIIEDLKIEEKKPKSKKTKE